MSLIVKLHNAKSNMEIKAILDQASDEELQQFLTTEQKCIIKFKKESKTKTYLNGLEYLLTDDDAPLTNSSKKEVLLLVLQRVKISDIYTALEVYHLKYLWYRMPVDLKLIIAYAVIAKTCSYDEKKKCITKLCSITNSELEPQNWFSCLMSNLGYLNNSDLDIPLAISRLQAKLNPFSALLLSQIYLQGMHSAGKPDVKKAAAVLSQAISAKSQLVGQFILKQIEYLLQTEGLDPKLRHKIQWHALNAYRRFFHNDANVTLDLLNYAKDHFDDWYTEATQKQIQGNSLNLARISVELGELCQQRNRGAEAIHFYKQSARIGYNSGWLRAATGYMQGWHDSNHPHMDFEAVVQCIDNLLEQSTDHKRGLAHEWVSKSSLSNDQKQTLVDRIYLPLFESILDAEEIKSVFVKILTRVVDYGCHYGATESWEKPYECYGAVISDKARAELWQSMLQKAQADIFFCLELINWCITESNTGFAQDLLVLANVIATFDKSALERVANWQAMDWSNLDIVIDKVKGLTQYEKPFARYGQILNAKQIYSAFYPKYILLKAMQEKGKEQRQLTAAIALNGKAKLAELKKLVAQGNLDAEYHLALCILDDEMSRYTNSWRVGYRKAVRKTTAFEMLHKLAYQFHPDSIKKYFGLLIEKNDFKSIKTELLTVFLHITQLDDKSSKQLTQLKSPKSPAWHALIEVVEAIQTKYYDNPAYVFISNFFIGILKDGKNKEAAGALNLAEQINKGEFFSLKTHLVNSVPWLAQRFDTTSIIEEALDAEKPEVQPSAPPISMYPDLATDTTQVIKSEQNTDSEDLSNQSAGSDAWVAKRKPTTLTDQVSVLAAMRYGDHTDQSIPQLQKDPTHSKQGLKQRH